MGEPMANYRAVIGAVRRLTDRRPTGSACPRAASPCRPSAWCRGSTSWPTRGIPVTLALSLHAPDDELRNELVPVNTRWSVHEAVEAAWGYARGPGAGSRIEYAMMRDINDQAWRADLLGDVLTSYGDWGWVHVNLIPLNPTPGSRWTASRPEVEREFVRRLEAKGVPDHGPRHPRQRDRRSLRPARRPRHLRPPRCFRVGGWPPVPGVTHPVAAARKSRIRSMRTTPTKRPASSVHTSG